MDVENIQTAKRDVPKTSNSSESTFFEELKMEHQHSIPDYCDHKLNKSEKFKMPDWMGSFSFIVAKVLLFELVYLHGSQIVRKHLVRNFKNTRFADQLSPFSYFGILWAILINATNRNDNGLTHYLSGSHVVALFVFSMVHLMMKKKASAIAACVLMYLAQSLGGVCCSGLVLNRILDCSAQCKIALCKQNKITLFSAVNMTCAVYLLKYITLSLFQLITVWLLGDGYHNWDNVPVIVYASVGITVNFLWIKYHRHMIPQFSPGSWLEIMTFVPEYINRSKGRALVFLYIFFRALIQPPSFPIFYFGDFLKLDKWQQSVNLAGMTLAAAICWLMAAHLNILMCVIITTVMYMLHGIFQSFLIPDGSPTYAAVCFFFHGFVILISFLPVIILASKAVNMISGTTRRVGIICKRKQSYNRYNSNKDTQELRNAEKDYPTLLVFQTYMFLNKAGTLLSYTMWNLYTGKTLHLANPTHLKYVFIYVGLTYGLPALHLLVLLFLRVY